MGKFLLLWRCLSLLIGKITVLPTHPATWAKEPPKQRHEQLTEMVHQPPPVLTHGKRPMRHERESNGIGIPLLDWPFVGHHLESTRTQELASSPHAVTQPEHDPRRSRTSRPSVHSNQTRPLNFPSIASLVASDPSLMAIISEEVALMTWPDSSGT